MLEQGQKLIIVIVDIGATGERGDAQRLRSALADIILEIHRRTNT